MNTLSRTGWRVATLAFVVMVAGMIATPLFARGGDERRLLAVVVVAALFACGLAIAVHAHGRRAAVAAAGIVVLTFAVEIIGSTTGFPFGTYDYTDQLVPQLFGVPVIVSLAWAGITLVVHGVLRVVRAGNSVSDWLIRLAMMAGAITAWDVFLDPQMVGEGYWVWQSAGPAFRGIPLVNYLGWLATASITSAIALALCGAPQRVTRLPIVVYATLAGLSMIGFVFFFDDLVVAVVGGLLMGFFVLVGIRHSKGRGA